MPDQLSPHIKQLETVETIPDLSEKVVSTKHAKLLPAYYILREAFKDKPFVKLALAKEYIAHYLGVSKQTAYAYLGTPCPFWEILSKRKGAAKRIKITSLHQVCHDFDLNYNYLSLLNTPVESFCGSIGLRKASLYQNAICKKGAERITDESGIFGRKWKRRKGRGKFVKSPMVPEGNSLGETILYREYNYPVTRDTIETRTDVPKSTQRHYGEILRNKHTGFQTWYNYKLVLELTKEEYYDIINHRCDLELMAKVLDITGNEPLGYKFKTRKLPDDCYCIIEQLPNSYQDFTERAGKNKERRLRRKVKALAEKSKTTYSKVNDFFFGPRYTDDGIYYEGATTIKAGIKRAFWVDIEDGQRQHAFKKLRGLKDYPFKDLKEYLSHDIDIAEDTAG